MRIVLITAAPPGVFCGVGDYTAMLGRGLGELGEEVTLLRGAPHDGTAGDMSRSCSDKVRVRPIVDDWSLAGLPRLRRAALETDPDIVHVQFPGRGYGRSLGPNLLPWTLGGRGRPQVVMTLHEYGIASAKGRLRILVGAIAADALVFPDEVIAAQVRSVLAPLGRPKVTRIIPAASSLPASPPDLDRGSFRRRFGLATDALTVGWFGLLTREKGADTLLDALAIARKQRELVLVVVGDVGAQSDAGELAAEVTARGLNNVFTGALSAPDAAAVLASLDVVALPFRDGLTARRTSYLGVRAQGTYIVTTSRERRGYDPGSNTHFVAPGDAPSLAAAILEATQRSRIATSNGSSWAPIVGAHRDLYRSL